MEKYTKTIYGPENETLSNMEDNVAKVLNHYSDNIVNDNIILESQTINTTTTLIAHKLGRKVRGWIICDKNIACTIHRDITSTADNKLFLALKSSAEVIVNILIF